MFQAQVTKHDLSRINCRGRHSTRVRAQWKRGIGRTAVVLKLRNQRQTGLRLLGPQFAPGLAKRPNLIVTPIMCLS